MQVLRGLLLGVIYGLALFFLRDASSAHWYLPAGLRFAALLALPPRYWGYIYAGEVASLLTIRVPLIETRGLAWAMVSTFTALPPVAAVVWLIRRRTSLPSVAKASDILALLIGALAIAVMATAINSATTYSLMHGRPSNPVDYVIGIWVLGQFLGILMFAPLVLLWHGRKARYFMANTLRIESAAAILGLGAAVLMFRACPDGARDVAVQVVRVVLGLEALALTYRHGWRGAAIGLVVVNLGAGLTAAADYDLSTLATQEMMAFVASALLLAGAAMTYNFEMAMQDRESRQRAEKASRQAWDDTEAQNREHAGKMASMYAQMRRDSEEIIGSLRSTRSAEDIMRLTGDLLAKTRSATTKMMHEVYPEIVFSADGIYGALRAKRFEPGIRYRTSFIGNPLSLSRNTSLTAYRVASAAMDYLAAMAPTEIRLRLRIVRARAGTVVYLRVRADTSTARSALDTANVARLRRRVFALGGLMRNSTGEVAILLADLPEIVNPHAWNEDPVPAERAIH